MGKLLNRKTIIVVIAIFLCFVTVYLIRIFSSSRSVQAFVSPLEMTVGEPVSYVDSTHNARKWLWNFGNGDTSARRNGTYIYKHSGKYQIKLIVDNAIEEKIIVNVLPHKKEDETYELIKIIAPEIAVQNELIIFRGTGDAKEWRWEFGETGNIDSRDRNSIYAYKEPGIYEVRLSTENTRYPIVHNIEILPQYMENDSTDVFVLIGNDIKEKLQAIADGKPFNTNYNYIMNSYLCKNPDVPVIVNNSKRNDFYSYCQGLRFIGRKKTLIDNVIVDVDGQSECVKKLTVVQFDK